MAPLLAEETTPLLVEARAERRGSLHRDSHNTADFDPNGDPDNPREWPDPFKWGIVALLAFMAFTVTFTCISVAPIAHRIVDDLNGDDGSQSATVLLITIWELGEAAGPLLIAPLSEIFGRCPLINVSNVLFIAGTVLAALSQNTDMFIAARALTGMAVSSNVLNPSIVGDIFPPEQRGKAISLFMFATLVGGTVGPAFSGAVTQSLGWRAVLWTSVVLAAACELVFFTCFRETYKVPILRRRAARWRKEAGSASMTADFGKETGLEKGSAGLRTSVMRPAAVLFGSGVLAVLSIFGSVIFAYFYIVSVTLPSILEEIYGLSPAAIGSAFLANGVGSFIGIVICNLCLDRIYVNLRKANNGIGLPEYRLPLAIVGAFTLPPAVALYGWCAEYGLPLALLLLSVVWIRLSLMLAFLPLMAYVVDACGLYSASAITGVIVIRCLAGAFLPLTTTLMVEHVGYGLGFTVLGALSLVLALVPVAVLRYGSHWRQRSRYTRTAPES
ncbi:putative transporter [Tolypocladium ophioglossoides CBS 100239]|uniref:Putative transporter n=1 Tax=Tolypocladium ophioglossoides (strain CBS 100239) TaxID=1163406 RepID=A0A0L0NEC1_TOLOC|nr:putative transporter [Tolypocladium ophioglossoides CBS 100239]